MNTETHPMVPTWRLLWLLLAVLGVPAPTVAQTSSEPEPYRNIDEFGVDLSSGSFNFTMVDVSGGSASSGIDITRVWGRSGWKDAYAGHLSRTGGSTITIVRGTVSEIFNLSGGVWTPAKANGTKLAQGPGTRFQTFTYTGSDGTVIVYSAVGANVFTPEDNYPNKYTISGPGGSCRISSPQNPQLTSLLCAVPVSITSTTGRKIDLSWREEGDCEQYVNSALDQGWQCDERYRLERISDQSGYSTGFDYQNTFYDYTPKWWTRTKSIRTDLSTGVSTEANYSPPSNGSQQVIDQHGRSWTFTYDSAGRMISITEPGASSPTSTITYGTDGKVIAVTKDGMNRTYSWSMSGGNILVAFSGGPGGGGTVTTNSSTGRPVLVTNANSNTVTSTYDAYGRLTRTTWPEGNYVQYTRDARGNVTQTLVVPKAGSGLANITVTANYDATCSSTATCNKPNYSIDGSSNRTDYTWSPTHGQVTREQLPAPTVGQPRPQVDYDYTALYAKEKNASGVLVNVATPQYKLTQITSCATAATCVGGANETKITMAYDTPNLQPTSVTVAAGDGSVAATSTYAYDGRDNVASVDGPLAGTNDTEYYLYDGTDRPVGTISPDPDGDSGNPRIASRMSYDSAGRIWKVESGTATGTTQAHLDAMTVLQAVETTFDVNDRMLAETFKDSNGGKVSLIEYSYDSAGRLQCRAVRMNPAAFSSLPVSACTLGTVGSYGPDRITKLHYDAAGRTIREESGVGTAEAGDDAAMTYTANGRVQTATDGEANRTTYEYDGLDRLAKVRFPVATKGAQTSSATDYEQYGYDARGNVTARRTRRDETLSFVYDALNRLTARIVPERSGLAATHTRDVHYGYDLSGRPTYARFDSASGEGVGFVFNALGRMSSTTQVIDGANRTLSYLYDAAGRRTRVTWPDNGHVTYAYDMLSRPTTIADSGSAVLRSYAYGPTGALSSDSAGGVASGSYGVDAALRLSSMGRDLAGSAADVNTTYSYNSAGQVASETRNNDTYAWTGHYNVDRPYTPNGLNQYTAAGPANFTYDANGNMISDGTTTFTYDVENRLVGVSGGNSGALRYDPLGRLYEISTGGPVNRLLYDGDALSGEYDTSGTMLRRFAHGAGLGDVPIAWYEGGAISSATRRYLYADRLGSITNVVSSSGSSLAINKYDEYGIPGAGNVGRFQYTGQAWLEGINLYHYKARIYSPTLGRFLQTDPIGYADGMNWYNYVKSDPVNFVDPTGMQCQRYTVGWTYSYYEYPTLSGDDGSRDPFNVQEVTSEFCANSFGDPLTYAGGRSGGGGGGPQNNCPLAAPTGRFRNSGADARFSPDTAAMLSGALANLNSQGIVPVMTSGYRSPALQASLRAGKSPLVITPARVSWHQVGGAVDFGPNSNAGNNAAIRSAMTQAGFVWGGNFRTPDVPHYQSHPAGTSPSAVQVSACSASAGG